jgi:hypothetical protein
MKYLLPLTLPAAAVWGARDSVSHLADHSFADGSTPTIVGDPPWLRGEWSAPAEALTAGAGDDPHAGLYGMDDPHAGLYGMDDPHASLEGLGAGSEVCPAGEMAPHDVAGPMLTTGDADPHATVLGKSALLEAGLDPRPVARSSAENGHSIAEVHAQRMSLVEHRIRVRGTVVKRTDGILGKSFLHVWDGSAPPETGADDLTVTTTEEFGIGETVELEGRLLIDQDLGLGYRYTALLDEATRVVN